LAANNNALYTFSFLTLLYFAVFSVVSARERSWFWATMPSKTFLSALAADALVGTVLTRVGLPGLLPLPWIQTAAIFAFAMISCLVINDTLKVALIKWLVPNAVARKQETKGASDAKTEPKPQAKAQVETKPANGPKPDAKVESKPEIKMEPKTESKPQVKLDATADPNIPANAEIQPEAKVTEASDLTPQIAKRAYELYEKRCRQGDAAVQDWEQARGEILKDEAKAGPKPDPKTQPNLDANSKPETKTDPALAAKVEPIPETKPDFKSDGTPPKPEAKAELAPEVKAPTKPEPKAKPDVEVSPQLVNRVHRLYEQLGREDVRAVQESEEAEHKIPEVEIKK
jgi:hypothetical protein